MQNGRQNGSLLQKYIWKYKIFPETSKHQGFACKMLILLILSYRHVTDASPRIWYIQDGIQDGSWQV